MNTAQKYEQAVMGLHYSPMADQLKTIIKQHNETVTVKTPKVQVAVSISPRISTRIETDRMKEIDRIIDGLEAEHETLRSDSLNWEAGLTRRIEIRRLINELDTEWDLLDRQHNG